MSFSRLALHKKLQGALIFLAISAGCGIAPVNLNPEAPTDFNSMLQQTPSRTMAPTIWPLDSSPTSILTRDLRTSTSTQTRTRSNTPLFTETALNSVPILMDNFLPEGAIARLGLGVVNQVAASPDGRTFTVAAGTGIYFYRSNDLHELWSIPTTKVISKVAFSGDGSTIAAAIYCNPSPHLVIHGGGIYCSDQQEIMIIQVETGKVINRIILDPGKNNIGPTPAISFPGTSIGLSIDGKKLFFESFGLSHSGSLSAWDAQTGTKIRDYPDSESRVLGFSGDGRQAGLVAGNSDEEHIDILNLADAGIVHRLSGDGTGYTTLAFSYNGAWIAAARDNEITLWNIPDEKKAASFTDPDGNITCLAFSPDGSNLLSGDDFGTATVWDLKSGKTLQKITGSGRGLQSAGYLSDGSVGFTTTREVLSFWNVSTGKPMPVPQLAFSAWKEARYIQNGTALALKGEGILQYSSPDGTSGLTSVKIPFGALPSLESGLVAESGINKQIIIREIKTNRPIHSFTAPDYFPIYTRNNENLFDDEGFFIQPPSGISFITAGRIIDEHNFIFSPNGKFAALLPNWVSITSYPSGELWDFSRNTVAHEILDRVGGSQPNTSLSRMIFSPDSSLYAVGSYDPYIESFSAQNITIYDTVSGQLVNQGYLSDPFRLVFAFSFDNQWLASGCNNQNPQGLICLYDVRTGAFVSYYTGDIGNDIVTSLGFSQDGKAVAAGTKWGEILLWDTASGHLINTFAGQAADITDLAFSPDGKTLASVSKDGTVILWNLSQE